ncbi:hypothetical protein WIV_gp181 [Wiseana iridescent virus]|uniref:Uncharacterized protein n=1 Tax=Wiseana iridescent virus TaxID=68347 RepID=G0T5K7_IRV9|nr:hypothetical protein WIV_gp181 [Wiseana iridescent virus]ADO00525.1 hypothetical protein [Wiseana iridescent virus]
MNLKFLLFLLFLLSNLTLILSDLVSHRLVQSSEQCVDIKFNMTRSECVHTCFEKCLITRKLGEELKISKCQNMLNTNLECICEMCNNF